VRAAFQELYYATVHLPYCDGVAAGEFGLGVDFGTSNTVAVLAWPDGRVKPLLFDGSPLLASAVYADPGDGLLVGRDAVHAARARPECFEPNPKRRIDEGLVLLGEVEVPVVDLIAAVLGRVAGEAGRITGTPVPTTLTCPAGWGPRRRQMLLDAAAAAGIADPDVVAEPVAAASYFVVLRAGDPVLRGGLPCHDARRASNALGHALMNRSGSSGDSAVSRSVRGGGRTASTA
jgi:hypothetical protein